MVPNHPFSVSQAPTRSWPNFENQRLKGVVTLAIHTVPCPTIKSNLLDQCDSKPGQARKHSSDMTKNRYKLFETMAEVLKVCVRPKWLNISQKVNDVARSLCFPFCWLWWNRPSVNIHFMMTWHIWWLLHSDWLMRDDKAGQVKWSNRSQVTLR